MKSHYLLAIPILASTLGANAEVTLDGSLGRSGALPGPDYLIGADLGQQRGGNLFHSFKDFNLNRLESATFSGPNSLNNIISRVTGGNPSNIDGLIRSTVPADMYFLNPNGIMFGPNAQLDVQGSFHASTADYLRLKDGGRFDARNPSDSLLTVAPIESFGFLTNAPAPITTQNSDLSVPENQTLSLIGGDIDLSGHSPVQFDEQGFMAVFARSQLSVPAGRINLASVSSKGEVILQPSELALNAQGGKISLDKTLVEASGKGAGAIFIRGGQLLMQDASIQANTMGDQNGKVIDLKLTGSINISGELQTILSKSFGNGNAGHVVITTPHLKIIGSSHIITSNFAQGNGGDIDIDSQRIKMTDGASIICATFGSGQCGDINIKATESISLEGASKGTYIRAGLSFINNPTAIGTTAHKGTGGQLNIESEQINIVGGVISTSSLGPGDSGDVKIHANTINATGGSLIASSGLSSGQVGNIDIHAKNTLFISGRRVGSYITSTGVKFENNRSSIGSLGMTNQGGNISISASTLGMTKEAFITASTLGRSTNETSGKIIIKADNLSITQGGMINNSNGIFFGGKFRAGSGHGGTIQIQAKNITIDADQSGLPTGIFSDTYSGGTGGNVEIYTNNLDITNDAAISAQSNSSGNAGALTIQAETIKLTNQGKISTEAENAAGGNITVRTHNLLYLCEGDITTSVGTGKGQGGDITIEDPTFVVLNQGQIKAQADEGRGGNIRIVAEQFITSPDSLISASSRLGLDGEVKIDSPERELSSFLLVLATDFDVSSQLKPPCNARVEQHENSLVVKRFAGGPSLPSDLQANMLILVQPENDKMPHQKTLLGKMDVGQPVFKVVFVECRADSSQATSSVIPEQLF